MASEERSAEGMGVGRGASFSPLGERVGIGEVITPP